jgi:hypothetical protein
MDMVFASVTGIASFTVILFIIGILYVLIASPHSQSDSWHH